MFNTTTSAGSSGYNAVPVPQAVPAARARFVRRTYGHLAGAILAFAVLEFLLLNAPGTEGLAVAMTGGWSWLLVLGAFGVVSYVADRWARSDASLGVQYAGLGLYVVAEAFIFLPLMYVAAYYSDPSVIPSAAVLTGVLFAGLTITAVTTRVDFSFLRGVLVLASLLALGLIVASILFGFSLGVVFAAAMVAVAAGAILYSTSNVMLHYRTDQYVAASLSLFAAVALMFYYVLIILVSLRR